MAPRPRSSAIKAQSFRLDLLPLDRRCQPLQLGERTAGPTGEPQAIGAAFLSDACAAVPARSRISFICARLGRSSPIALAKCSIHSAAFTFE